VLATAVLRHPDLAYRLRLVDSNGQERTLFTASPLTAGSSPQWETVRLPMEEFAGEAVILRLEVKSAGETTRGYWANPRFEIGSSGFD